MGASELIDEALEALRDFEVGKDQLNERSAMTLLALLHLKEGDSWEQATNPMMGNAGDHGLDPRRVRRGLQAEHA